MFNRRPARDLDCNCRVRRVCWNCTVSVKSVKCVSALLEEPDFGEKKNIPAFPLSMHINIAFEMIPSRFSTFILFDQFELLNSGGIL